MARQSMPISAKQSLRHLGILKPIIKGIKKSDDSPKATQDQVDQVVAAGAGFVRIVKQRTGSSYIPAYLVQSGDPKKNQEAADDLAKACFNIKQCCV
jgi:hypothetical protein